MDISDKKIVFIIPPQSGAKKEHLPSVGIAYLAAVMEKNGCQVKIIDSHAAGFDVKQTIQEALAERPFLVGISANSHNRFKAIEVINGIKSSNPSIYIVAGGHHFSPAAEDAISNIPSLDVVVRNEGEMILPRLVQSLIENSGLNPEKLRSVRGLTFRDGKEVVSTPDEVFIENLDELPYPAWHLFNLDSYNARLEGMTKHRAIGVMSSRGCPHACIFCANNTFWQRRFRRFSPSRFVDEVEFLYRQHGFHAFDFCDDTMTMLRPHVEEICNQIIQRKLPIVWYARARVDTVDRPLLLLMKQAGCRAIGFGVESGSDNIIKTINKQISLLQVKEIAAICRDLKLNTKFFFVYGLPQEEKEDLELTFSLMSELASYSQNIHCYSGIIRIYPGTQLEKLAKKEGSLPLDFSWHQPVNFEINHKFNADPIIPLYQNKLLPLPQIADMIQSWESARIKNQPFNILVKKGFRLIFSSRSLKEIRNILNIVVLKYVKSSNGAKKNKKKKRMLVVTRSLSIADGLGRYSVGLIDNLKDKYDLTIFASYLADAKERYKDDNNLKFYSLPNDRFLNSLFINFLTSWRLLRHVWQADIIHSFVDVPQCLLFSWWPLFKKPFFVTVHGTYGVLPLDRGKTRSALIRVYKKAKKVICVSQYTAKQILKRVNLGNLIVINNGIDCNNFKRDYVKETRKEKVILSVGALKPRKGYHIAIPSIAEIKKQYPDIKYWIVGGKPPQIYLDMVKQYNLEENVKFFENISDEEMIRLYYQADVFLMPSITINDNDFEGFGLVYLEAGACGLPVIGTYNCGAEDAIINGKTGLLVEQNNVLETSQAILKLLANPDLSMAMGENGRQRAAQMNWQIASQKYIKEYES